MKPISAEWDGVESALLVSSDCIVVAKSDVVVIWAEWVLDMVSGIKVVDW